MTPPQPEPTGAYGRMPRHGADGNGDAHGPRPLDRGSPLPLWAQLRDDLRRRVEAGAFAEEFPAEHRLTGEYEVSRHTVREALRKLRADGLVIAERGRASRLDARRIHQPLGSSTASSATWRPRAWTSTARCCGWSGPRTRRSPGTWA
ncbi:GntR family transcriptional regulator [Streptomyces albulus]|nr:GntR family transcriptional regulator [Streptomyces noursei]